MGTLRSSFLGSIAEVCIVSGDHKKTMDGLLQLGIGPFQVFDFTPNTVLKQYFRGQVGSFELKVCFAKHGDLTFEIMQPTAGESLMAEFLNQVSEQNLQQVSRAEMIQRAEKKACSTLLLIAIICRWKSVRRKCEKGDSSRPWKAFGRGGKELATFASLIPRLVRVPSSKALSSLRTGRIQSFTGILSRQPRMFRMTKIKDIRK